MESQKPSKAATREVQRASGSPELAFASKVTVRAKVLIAGAVVAVVCVSFFLGTYSLSGGYTLGDMLACVAEHWGVYFWCLQQRLALVVNTLGADGLAGLGACLDHVLAGLAGSDVPGFVSDPPLDRSLFSIRLPRILLVLLVGAALSTAGASFQGMFKNPLVSPDLLGASAGASLGACLAMLCDAPNIMVQLGAFAGGLVAVGCTVWMRGIVKTDAILGLVLAGMLVSTLFQSGMSFVKLVADTDSKLPAITYWLMGSFAGATGRDFWLAIAPMLVGFALMVSQSWKLNVMSFGDEEARSMGVNTRRARLVVILGATLVTSTSVAVAGIVGWVGLVIPHFARAVVGPNYKVLLPTCLLLGALYLLCIDDLARMLFNGVEIPIGILTSILGVPFFLVIFRRSSRGW